jgi:hypothetical protein
MSVNYNASISSLGLPPVQDQRQIHVHTQPDQNPDAFIANEVKILQDTDSYVKEAQQKNQPFVDLYDVMTGSMAKEIGKQPLPDSVKAYSLDKDTVLLHTHQSPFDSDAAAGSGANGAAPPANASSPGQTPQTTQQG